MLDKIVLSKDRKSAVVHFDTHSVHFHSDCDVMVLIYEIIIEPSLQNVAYWAEMERRHINSLEDTVEIDLTKIDEDAA
jgi:hypothetical protein